MAPPVQCLDTCFVPRYLFRDPPRIVSRTSVSLSLVLHLLNTHVADRFDGFLQVSRLEGVEGLLAAVRQECVLLKEELECERERHMDRVEAMREFEMRSAREAAETRQGYQNEMEVMSRAWEEERCKAEGEAATIRASLEEEVMRLRRELEGERERVRGLEMEVDASRGALAQVCNHLNPIP